jgi:hypothetical protein
MLEEAAMVFRFTGEEVELVREALAAYAATLAAKSRTCGPGYSERAIDLCCRRLNAEILCEDLLNRQPRLAVVAKRTPAVSYLPAAPSSRMYRTS